MMKLSMILAAAQNGTIGVNNALPWYLPEDLKYFRAVTMGKPVVMGRKTWESIGKPLPGRTNIVITRNADYVAEGAKVVTSVDEALEFAEAQAMIDGVEELMLIGGAELYRLAEPFADRIYLTEVLADVAGDAAFNLAHPDQWSRSVISEHAAEGPNPYDYRFVVLERADNA